MKKLVLVLAVMFTLGLTVSCTGKKEVKPVNDSTQVDSASVDSASIDSVDSID